MNRTYLEGFDAAIHLMHSVLFNCSPTCQCKGGRKATGTAYKEDGFTTKKKLHYSLAVMSHCPKDSTKSPFQ